MRPPTLVALDLKRQLSQYLATTYGLVDEPVRDSLAKFLNDPDDGVFRGQYLKVRTPFRSAEPGWEESLGWIPAGFRPHRHQALAWRRLSSLDGDPSPTLVTTGTGSGKTESFLYPVLDHCRRHRAAPGVKALLLYPMNALATDQAERLNGLLSDPALSGVTAGLYVGEKAETTYEHVLTERRDMRVSPPDVLVTNYKMLDLMLQRPEDAPLWSSGALTYVVVDEFHTYDGAQGTDVAMLLRRLRAVAGAFCPVATSATLSSGEEDDDPEARIRETAATVFGVPFDDGSVITEDRLTAAEFIADVDGRLPLPDPQELVDAGDPFTDATALDRIMELVVGTSDLTPSQLGGKLKQHVLTQSFFEANGGADVRRTDAVFDVEGRGLLYSWWRYSEEVREEALARFAALLSIARDPDAPSRPFAHLDVQLWVRSVSRLLRDVGHEPTFRWEAETGDRPALPAIQCRHCGRSGWAAIAPESSPEDLKLDPAAIYREIGAKTRRRNMITATSAEIAAYRSSADDVGLFALDGGRLRPVDAGDVAIDAFVPRTTDDDTGTADASNVDGGRVEPGVPVWVDLVGPNAGSERCPSCRLDNGIRYIGTGTSTLTSVVVTNLFTSAIERDVDKKTLLFSNAVQDAAHRAGFLSARSHGFSVRALLASVVDDGESKRLNDIMADAVVRLAKSERPGGAIPPDLYEDPGVRGILEEHDSGSSATWELLSQRLALSAVLEFGLRSRQGRTLELTRTAAVEVEIDDLDAHAAYAEDVFRQTTAALTMPTRRQFEVFIRGLLERLRLRGALHHRWLDGFIAQKGVRRWPIWGGRTPGMPAFPAGVSAPEFALGTDVRSKDFTVLGAKGTWYADWARRCLGLDGRDARLFVPRLASILVGADVLASRAVGDVTVFGLTPGHVRVHKLTDAELANAVVGCDTCSWEQTVPPAHHAFWTTATCPRFRCSGTLHGVTPSTEPDYYRRLYRGVKPFRVHAAEHTGSLTREQRETVEAGFRSGRGVNDPNVLSATSTLELGIDIGALSAVVLGGVAPNPAAHVQRAGRAGRKTGNSLVVTVTGSRPRDRHFFADPTLMLSGRIVPPGSYLSAIELLRRQYMAFLLDKVGRGDLGRVTPVPRTTAQLFGRWIDDFVETALLDGARCGEEFLAMFDGDIEPVAAQGLREYALAGIAERVKRVKAAHDGEKAEYRQRIKDMDAAAEALDENDDEERHERRLLMAGLRGVRRRLGDLGNTNAHETLIRHGLLPNYALTDAATTLEATLTRVTENDGDRTYESELRSYDRPARQALTEIAPGNTYYVRGYRHRVDGIDIGSGANRSWRTWHLCSSCGYVDAGGGAAELLRCARCGSGNIGDTGQRFTVIVPTKVFAEDKQDDAHIRDDSEDREQRHYTTIGTVDVNEADIVSAWRLTNATFGADYTRDAIVRHLNFGVGDGTGDSIVVAGHELSISPFWVCRDCGGTALNGDPELKADKDRGDSRADPNRFHHRPWCRNRSTNTGHRATVLAHELPTEAVRILLPVATMRAPEQVESFRAALMLGIAATYGGDPQHLDSLVATMPDHTDKAGDHDGASGGASIKSFVVVYDTLPGGTGYLHQLADAERMRTVLSTARDRIAACDCHERGNPACHRCLLAWTSERHYKDVRRSEALALLEKLLTGWDAEASSGIHDISMLKVIESELETRFVDKLREWADATEGASLTATASGEADLRIGGPGREPTRWKVTQQHTIDYTRPDVLFERVDGPPVKVALYLDGFKYHATTEHNRLADDAVKRNRLHAQDVYVFSVTWKDVETWRVSSVTEAW
ncbi:DEAD/DEAH box helicase, partial [Stackebrandtia soli]|uniref:DEAD/DEAH box helicase n=1 Tax=Stackebrandtia soli TaxID=1892856 RepID=UPI0039E74A5A